MPEEAKVIADVLKTLANEHRLQILCELIEQPRTVGALGERIPGISQSALSQHLALLKAHGVVRDRKAGQSVTYSIADHRIEELVAVLRRLYCRPNA